MRKTIDPEEEKRNLEEERKRQEDEIDKFEIPHTYEDDALDNDMTDKGD